MWTWKSVKAFFLERTYKENTNIRSFHVRIRASAHVNITQVQRTRKSRIQPVKLGLELRLELIHSKQDRKFWNISRFMTDLLRYTKRRDCGVREYPCKESIRALPVDPRGSEGSQCRNRDEREYGWPHTYSEFIFKTCIGSKIISSDRRMECDKWESISKLLVRGQERSTAWTPSSFLGEFVARYFVPLTFAFSVLRLKSSLPTDLRNLLRSLGCCLSRVYGIISLSGLYIIRMWLILLIDLMHIDQCTLNGKQKEISVHCPNDSLQVRGIINYAMSKLISYMTYSFHEEKEPYPEIPICPGREWTRAEEK